MMAKMPKMKTPPPRVGIQGAQTGHTAPGPSKAMTVLPKGMPTSRGRGMVPLAAGGKGKKVL